MQSSLRSLRRTALLAVLGLAGLPAGPAFAEAREQAAAPAIHFARNQMALGADDRLELRRIASLLRARPDLQVEVLGHGDDTGNVAYDQELSYQRARLVARVLASHGVPITDIYATGVGPIEPVAASGNPANRRVQITLRGPGASADLARVLYPAEPASARLQR